MLFNKSPFLRLTFPFALGIVSYHYLGDQLYIPWVIPIVFFALFLILSRINSHFFSSSLSVLAMFILFSLGFLRLETHRLDSQTDHLLWLKDTVKAYEAVLVSEPAIKQRSVNLRLDIKRALTNEGWQQVSGRVNAYASKESAMALSYGDRLLVQGSPARTEAPANPGEFDFANYLVYNNIFHQQFIGEHFSKTGESNPNWLLARSIAFRSQCRDLLARHIHDPEVRSVMMAIVLGIKDELDNELQSAFSASGAMHVLAVSGLHVGIIYGIILLIFKQLRLDPHRARWLMAIVSILALWCYAFVTGLSPSVLRAVTMFSFMALAKAMNRNGNIYNTLAASAFLLLWYNPYLIMSVGFQLSYMAVFGIVYLQPKLYRLVTFNGWLADKVWAITCVSLAAQVATAPLSMLYFHQFPSYFLVSNLFIIPAAFIMLLMGLGMLIFSTIPFLGEIWGRLIEVFVQLVNSLVFWVRDLPGSTMEGIRITTGQTWMVYTVIILLILLFYSKKFKYLVWSVGMACLFAVSQVAHRSDYLKSSTFRMLDVSRATVLDFRHGDQGKLVADSAFSVDQGRRRFHFEPGRLLAGVNLNPEKDRLPLAGHSMGNNELFCFKEEVFLILREPLDNLQVNDQRLVVDHLIVSENALTDLQDVSDKLSFDHLLIDASNTAYITKKLVSQAKALDLKVHAVAQDGYFEKLWQ